MSFLHDAIMESNELLEEEIMKFESQENSSEITASPQPKPIVEDCNKKEIKKEVIIDEELVDIEDYLPKEAYIEESMQKSINEDVIELPDRYAKGRPGSPEYDANDRRRAREAEYRKLINVGSDFEITEDNIKDWAVNRVCSDFRCDPVKLKTELLKQPYTGLEKYSED